MQYEKAQISILSVSQTKELITGTGNRDKVLFASPLGLFSNLPWPLPITSCVKTHETCEVELWWLLLLADILRRQNVVMLTREYHLEMAKVNLTGTRTKSQSKTD